VVSKLTCVSHFSVVDEVCALCLQDEFATEEEPTTAFVTYSNIPYPQNLPLIDYDIKAKMLGLEKTPADEVKPLNAVH